MSQCQCPKCGHTFSGLTYFDKHQDVDYRRVPAVLCRSPVSVGLVQEPGGIWTTPEGLKARESARTRLAAARSRRT